MTAGTIRLSSSQDPFRCESGCIPDPMLMSLLFDRPMLSRYSIPIYLSSHLVVVEVSVS